MSDKFSVISIEQLYIIIDKELNKNNSIFGIPKELFFKQQANDRFKVKRYNILLDTPVGVAAGPHTQMAQNIISAWLCGSSYIELKTVQTLDKLKISKPCIDMQDEGYNCEWSQELEIKESFNEYLKAWILIHVLNHKLKLRTSKSIGTIFNMSVGYNLEGILKPNVQWFFNKMDNCKIEKESLVKKLSNIYPQANDINIPNQISNNVTLSTMHGCPPSEIEKIGLYLINKKKLHTTVKLNPTLLGKTQLKYILKDKLGFKTIVPDLAFEHDLKYKQAITIINNLQKASKNNNLQFSLKLTNTLESINHKSIFNASEKMMYMSGRALHPISINLAKKLQNDFKGELDISFSAGANCFNIESLLKCGFKTITVCSDLLKPGGYGRLSQYLKHLTNYTKPKNSLKFLNLYANKVINENLYKYDSFNEPDIKTKINLKTFDCINAPCVDTCPTNQDIPDYLYLTSTNNYEKAFEVILKKNPFPATLGMVCDHTCQTKCTRINYDNNIQIKDVKRFIAEYGIKNNFLKPKKENNLKVSIIGAGPSGLSCAYFLRLAGFKVNVYESKETFGGMISTVIPEFRLNKENLINDVNRIKNLGIKIYFNYKVDSKKFSKIKKESDFVYIATGAQNFNTLDIKNNNLQNVINPYDFLTKFKNNEKVNLGQNVIVIGGGNTAIDVARAAKRISSKNSNITIVYRRTINEMPAEPEEIKALISENIKIIELAIPEKIIQKNNKAISLVCYKAKLGKPDSKGRPTPEIIANSEFYIPASSIIYAIGQNKNIDFVNNNIFYNKSIAYQTTENNIFIGGDAMRGASTIVKAVADGRKTAELIFKKAYIKFSFQADTINKKLKYNDYIIKKSERVFGNNYENESSTTKLTKSKAIKESSRCLLCNDVCSVCVTVCPNRANYSYFVKPQKLNIYKYANKKILIDSEFELKQSVQILNINNFCNECGNCATFCPTNGKPFSDKPKFSLTKKNFDENTNVYYYNTLHNTTTLLYKNNDSTHSLSKFKEKYLYKTKNVEAQFSLSNFKLISVKTTDKKIKDFYFDVAAKMYLLFDAAKDLY